MQNTPTPHNIPPEEDDIITLERADGEKIEFEEIAGIIYKFKFYALLKPVEPVEGVADDEAIIFEVIHLPGGDRKYNLVTDEEVMDGVFAEYLKLLTNIDNG